MERPEIEEWKAGSENMINTFIHNSLYADHQILALCDHALTLEARLKQAEEALKNIKTFADERAECSVYLANIAWACDEALKGLGKEKP